jgi:hypothetical protein
VFVQREFLDLCWQKAPILHLTDNSFALMSDLFRVALREANNQRDFGSVKSIFDLSSLYGTTRLGARMFRLCASRIMHS